MTRGGKVLVGVLVTFAALGALAVVAYVLYVAVIVALLHAAFNPSCPPSYETMTNACTDLARRDRDVHCNSSREGPTPSGPQGVCEAFNRVELDWEPSVVAGPLEHKPNVYGGIVETKDVFWDAGAWSCESKGLTFYLTPGNDNSPDDIVQIRASFDKACASFRSR